MLGRLSRASFLYIKTKIANNISVEVYSTEEGVVVTMPF